MKKLLIGVLVVAVLAGISFGSFLYGKQYENSKSGATYNAGYDKGHGVGFANGLESASASTVSIEEYNALEKDYNELLTKVRAYNNQSRQNIICNSHTYGIDGSYTSTNCY